MNRKREIANMGIDESKLPDLGDGTDPDRNAAWFNAVGDQLHEYNVVSKSHRERLQRIEDLLGSTGCDQAVETMDGYLPDGEWTDEEWNEALDKTSAELYGNANQYE